MGERQRRNLAKKVEQEVFELGGGDVVKTRQVHEAYLDRARGNPVLVTGGAEKRKEERKRKGQTDFMTAMLKWVGERTPGPKGGTMTLKSETDLSVLVQIGSVGMVSRRDMKAWFGIGMGFSKRVMSYVDRGEEVQRAGRFDACDYDAMSDFWHDERISSPDSSRSDLVGYPMWWRGRGGNGRPVYRQCHPRVLRVSVSEAKKIFRESEERKKLVDARQQAGRDAGKKEGAKGDGYSDFQFERSRCGCVKEPKMTSCTCEICARPSLLVGSVVDARMKRRYAGKTLSKSDPTCARVDCKACTEHREEVKLHAARKAVAEKAAAEVEEAGKRGAEGGQAAIAAAAAKDESDDYRKKLLTILVRVLNLCDKEGDVQ